MILIVCFLQQENRYRSEMEGHKNKLDVEYEQLMNNFQRELDSLRDKHLKDLDKWVSLRRVMQGLLLARCFAAFHMYMCLCMCIE